MTSRRRRQRPSIGARDASVARRGAGWTGGTYHILLVGNQYDCDHGILGRVGSRRVVRSNWVWVRRNNRRLCAREKWFVTFGWYLLLPRS
jgi:hypothetical protein